MMLQLLCVYARSDHPGVHLNLSVIDSIEREVKLKANWLAEIKELVGK